MIGQVFSAYSEYKDSGIDWLGEIPKHWTSKKLKFMARINNGKDYKSFEVEDSGYPVIGSGGQFAYSSKYMFMGESVLFGRKGTIDKPLYVNEAFWTVDTMFYSQINNNTYPKFFYYCALTLPFNYYSTNTAVPSMTQEALDDHFFAFPTLQEQKEIAKFLDRATTEIDQIIEQQKQLITLLEEERTTVISHAVTKGLDPSVPMKDSGIEWLGEIPKHWEVKPFKHITKRVDVGIAEAATHAYCDEGTPIIRSTNVRANRLELDDVFCIQEWFAEKNKTKYLYTGDIVTVRTGNAGVSAVIPPSLNKSQCFTLLMSTLQENQVPEFYCFYLNSDLSQVIFSLEGWGTAQVNISVPILKNLFVVEPPFNEQKQIVNYIYQETARIDEAIENVRSQIEKLEEYRTVLISDAVTGKIDVRGFS